MLKFCTPYDILGGILSGLLMVVIATAFAALVFKGPLIAFFSLGISCALIGVSMTNLLTASFGSFRFGIARIEPTAAAVLAVIFANIARTSTLPSISLFPTLLIALGLATLMVGASMFLLGFFRLGHIIRFLPYPVLGGLVCGTSWMMGYTSFSMMVNNNFTLQNLLRPESMLQYLSGICFAIFLFIAIKKIHRAWILPVSLIIFSIAINSVLFFNHLSHTDAIAQGWFLSAFTPAHMLQSIDPSLFQHIDWMALFYQLGYFLSFAAVIIIILLFNISSLETTYSRQTDLDHELKISGMGNLLSGLLGGAAANLSLTGTLVNNSMGSQHRLSGVIASFVCILVLFFYPAAVSYLPKPMIGGLLIYIALNLLFEWLYTDWHKLPLIDYLIVVAILITIAIYGFMPGVITGIMITCAVFIIRYARIDAIKFATSRQHYPSNVIRPHHEQHWLNKHGDVIQIFKLQNYLFFGSVKFLLDRISKLIEKDSTHKIQYLIFDFQLVNGIDSSASFSFIRLQQLITNLTLQLLFTNCSKELLEQLKHQDVIGDPSRITILPNLDQGIEWCENQLLKSIPPDLKPKELSISHTLSQLMLADKQQIIFKKYLERMAVPANFYLCQQGEMMDCLYFIESGEVSVLLRNDEAIMRLSKSGPGTIVGEIGFYLNAVRTADVRTETPCIIYKLTIASMNEIETAYPDIALCFQKSIIRVLALRIIQTNDELRLMSQ